VACSVQRRDLLDRAAGEQFETYDRMKSLRDRLEAWSNGGARVGPHPAERLGYRRWRRLAGAGERVVATRSATT